MSSAILLYFADTAGWRSIVIKKLLLRQSRVFSGSIIAGAWRSVSEGATTGLVFMLVEPRPGTLNRGSTPTSARAQLRSEIESVFEGVPFGFLSHRESLQIRLKGIVFSEPSEA